MVYVEIIVYNKLATCPADLDPCIARLEALIPAFYQKAFLLFSFGQTHCFTVNTQYFDYILLQ